MKFQEFWDSPNLNAKTYLLSGDEPFFKYLIKNLLVKGLKGYEFVYVNAEADSPDFYEQIESTDLLPHPKLYYIDNEGGGLTKHKHFWAKVAEAGPDIRFLVSDAKKPPADVLEIECPKIRDLPAEVTRWVETQAWKLGITISSKDLPVFHYLYRNNLFAIHTELKKCKIWSESTGNPTLDYPTLKSILSPSAEKDPFSFSTNFLKRRLKACATDMTDMPESEAILQVFNIFKAAEKVLVYKTALASKMSESEIISQFDFKPYYVSFIIKPVEKLWQISELKNLLLDSDGVTFKTKTLTSYPSKHGVMSLVLKYCR